uniref:Tail protein n=1 Tax=viral metagenome TaxID=1070528 RepID=A0A6M3L8W6_9ZZZZ
MAIQKDSIGLSMSMDPKDIDKMRTRLNVQNLLGGPLNKVFGKAGLLIQKAVMMATPVQTGRLRASTFIDVDQGIIPKSARIGTSVTYATTVEYGGTWNGKHFPPRYVLGVRSITDYASGAKGRAKRIFEGIGPYQYAFRENIEKAKEIIKDITSSVEKIWRD